MKKLAMIFSLLAICGFMLGACGDDDGNGGDPCADLMAKTMIPGYDEACTGKGDTCCTCQCWLDGQKVVDTYDGTADPKTCTCKEDEAVECTSDLAALAKACLADQTCVDESKADYKTTAEDACTANPLQ